MKKVDYSLKNLEIFNTSFIVGLPVVGLIALGLHLHYEGFNAYLLIPAFIMYFLTTFSISGGYHRLFAHRTYKANTFLKVFLLLFGGASGENTALKWAADHRRHHAQVDTDNDPHSILNGLFYAHVGWVCLKEDESKKSIFPKDLLQDKWVMWQHNNYLWIAMGVNFLAIVIAAYFTGAIWGSIAIVGLLRLTFVHHITFCINSLCHVFGRRPYDLEETARDSMILAFITFGEGYHNFHHAFPSDYRNGIRWYHWDPTKWLLNGMNSFGMASGFKKTSETAILRAKMEVMSKIRLGEGKQVEHLSELQEKVQAAQRKLIELKAEYIRLRFEGQDKIEEIKQAIREAKIEFKELYKQWVQDLQLQAQLA